MNRYVKLSAALLAGMLASGVVMAEEHKYFECNITEVTSDTNPTASCGGNLAKVCSGTKRFILEELKKGPSEYSKESDDGVFYNKLTISRADGRFTSSMFMRTGKSHVERGTCQLKTDKLKF